MGKYLTFFNKQLISFSVAVNNVDVFHAAVQRGTAYNIFPRSLSKVKTTIKTPAHFYFLKIYTLTCGELEVIQRTIQVLPPLKKQKNDL